jgi:hypothetical protein
MTKQKMTITEKLEAKTAELQERKKNGNKLTFKTMKKKHWVGAISAGLVLGIAFCAVIDTAMDAPKTETKAEAKADVKPEMITKGGIGAYATKTTYKPGEYIQVNVINIDKVAGSGHARLQGALSEEPVKDVVDYTTFQLGVNDKGTTLAFAAPYEPGKYQIVVKMKDVFKGELWTSEITVKK